MRYQGRSLLAASVALAGATASTPSTAQKPDPAKLAEPPRSRPVPPVPTYHPQFRRSTYMPHQGSQERLRRWKQMEKQRERAS